MLVLGIDPGYAIVGFGCVQYEGNVFTPLQYGAIKTQSHTNYEDRLLEVYNDIVQVIHTTKPDAMAIETLFFTTNQKTAIAVAQARGVILLAAKQAGVPIFEYTPMQIKNSVVGYGSATKKQVQEMTKRILKLQAVPKPDDTADALAVAICHSHACQSAVFGLNVTKRQQMGYF